MIGAVGSMFFLGWAAFSVVVPSIADKYGRKYVITLSCIFTTLSVLVISVSSSVYVLLFCSFVIGIMTPGRSAVSYVYIMENLTPEWRPFVTTLI